jgi:hypothetical protein
MAASALFLLVQLSPISPTNFPQLNCQGCAKQTNWQIVTRSRKWRPHLAANNRCLLKIKRALTRRFSRKTQSRTPTKPKTGDKPWQTPTNLECKFAKLNNEEKWTNPTAMQKALPVKQ